MATPPAYATDTPTLESTFGHHDVHFAALPSYKEFHQVLDMMQGLEDFIHIDIHEAIGVLMDNQDAELVVKVPTLGFTDPAYDYDIRPLFATPFSLNGYGAKAEAILASRPAKVIAVDFMGNEYPLAFNQQGLIDYAKIAEAAEGKLYTTLKAIHYVYSAAQVLNGEDLTLLPMSPYHQGFLLMRPPETMKKPFDIEVLVANQSKVLLQTEYHHAVDGHAIYHLNQLSVQVNPNGDGSKLDIFMDASTYQGKLPSQLAIRLEIADLMMNDGIIAEQGGKEPVSLTHYLGFSDGLMNQMIDILVSKDKLTSSLSMPNNDVFNDFSQPSVMNAFFGIIKEGVVDNSIPLMALSDYFFDDININQQIKAMNLDQMTKADHEVFSGLIKSLTYQEDITFDLADKLDQMLSLDKFYPQAHFSLMSEMPLEADKLGLHLELHPLGEDSFVSQNYFAKQGVLFQEGGFEEPSFIDDHQQSLFFSDQAIEHVQNVGHRFQVSTSVLLDGAQIIDNFNLANHDVLDLNELFSVLPPTSEPRAVEVEVKGDDLQVWITDESQFGTMDKVHVATLTGVGLDDSGLPNLDQFIEYPS